jgi:WD40 repeat protein
VCVSNSSQQTAVGTSDNNVLLWHAERKKQVRCMRGHSARVGSLSFNQVRRDSSRPRLLITYTLQTNCSQTITKCITTDCSCSTCCRVARATLALSITTCALRSTRCRRLSATVKRFAASRGRPTESRWRRAETITCAAVGVVLALSKHHVT